MLKRVNVKILVALVAYEIMPIPWSSNQESVLCIFSDGIYGFVWYYAKLHKFRPFIKT